MPKKLTSISHNLPFHREILFSSQENEQKKRKRRSRQVAEFMFNKKESVLSMELSCELRDR